MGTSSTWSTPYWDGTEECPPSEADTPSPSLRSTPPTSPATEASFGVERHFRYPLSIPVELRGAVAAVNGTNGGLVARRVSGHVADNLSDRVVCGIRYYFIFLLRFVKRAFSVDGGQDGKYQSINDCDLEHMRNSQRALKHAADVRVRTTPGNHPWYWVIHEPVGLPLDTHAAGHAIHVWPNAVNKGKTRHDDPWEHKYLHPRRFLSPLELRGIRSLLPTQVTGVRIFMAGVMVALFDSDADMVEAYRSKRGCPSDMANFNIRFARLLCAPWIKSRAPERLSGVGLKPRPALGAPEAADSCTEAAISDAMEGKTVYHVFKGKMKYAIVEAVEYVWDWQTGCQSVSLVWRCALPCLEDADGAIQHINDLGTLHNTLCFRWWE